MDKVAAVIPAAGQGRRMNSSTNKQFMLIQGMPVIVHTLEVFQKAPEITEIILVCAPGEECYYDSDFLSRYGITKPFAVVTGGKERQHSVYRGLSVISPDCRYIMIHDGARPLVESGILSEAAREVRAHRAITVGVPVKDTVKRTDDNGFVVDTPQRDGLWLIQTPQVFERELIVSAHEAARADCYVGTDDASLVERLGVRVKILRGSYENIKITTPEDIIFADSILRWRGQS